MTFCTECGANAPEGIQFCTECGAPIGETAQPVPVPAPAAAPIQTAAPAQQAPPPQAAPPRQATHIGDAPPKGSPYAVMSTGSYILTMILFAIPVIGWLACVIMALVAGNRNRRNLARATLVFLIIGIILSVTLYFVVGWAWQAVAEFIRGYVSTTTGGVVSEFNGSSNLFGILNEIGLSVK